LLGWGVYSGFVFIRTKYFKPKAEDKDRSRASDQADA